MKLVDSHCHLDMIDLAPHEADFKRFDVVPHVEGMDPGLVGKARKLSWGGPGGDDEFVPPEISLFPVRLDVESPGLDIDRSRPPRSQHLDPFV